MAKSETEVFTLVVTVGRTPDDGLPEGSIGANLLCFAAANSEDASVREAVSVLKTAGLAPLEVTSYGTLSDRVASGNDLSKEEKDLMQRALEENAVVVVEVLPDYADGPDA